MTKLCVLLALLAPLLPACNAQYPAIEAEQGFEVDMEPAYIVSDFEPTDPVPLDVQGYFLQEMQVVLPNLMGVILKKYEDTEWSSTAETRAFYTGMAVFRGPPFRTNHDVYRAQTAAITSLRAAKTYLHVHNASLGIPEWFDSTSLGIHDTETVQMIEETDGTIKPSDLFGNHEPPVSAQSVAMGAAMGFVLGTIFTLAVLLCHKRSMDKSYDPTEPTTPRKGTPRHKRKGSDDILSVDEEACISADDRDDDAVEEFCDEEEGSERLTSSPTQDRSKEKGLTPVKRRPSHHRRWKSTAFGDMKSPSSVMDGLFLTSSPKTCSHHRRANSVADDFHTASSHRRSNSMADAFKVKRRESMVELLGIDLEELHNDDGDFAL